MAVLAFYSNHTGSLTFEVVLHETSNVIDFLYRFMSGPVPPGCASAVGLNGPSNTVGTAVCGPSPQCPEVSTNTRVRFVPTR